MAYNPLIQQRFGVSDAPKLTARQQHELDRERFLAFVTQFGFNYKTVTDVLPNTLVLDISKSGTGVAILHDKQLYVDTLVLSGIEDPVELRKTFREYIVELHKSFTFEHVIIEDVIGSLNFKTANILYQLNPIVDDMMEIGLIPKAKIHRVDNGVWRMYLQAVTQYTPSVSGYSDTKTLVQNCLSNVGMPSYWNNDNESDALGMLLGVGVVDILGYTYKQDKTKYKPNIRKGYTIQQFYENPISNEAVKLPQAVLDKLDDLYYSDLVGRKTDIIKASKKLIQDFGTDIPYLVRIESEKLGVLALEKNLSYTNEPCYILFYHTKGIKE